MTLGKTKEWHAVKDNVVWSLGLWQLGMFGLIFCLCIYFSHKIAGPIYKLGKFLVKVREEGVVTKLAFRKADYFEELAEEYNKTMEYISTKQREDFTYLSEVTTYLSNLAVGLPDDKKMVVHEISKNLTEIQERYLNS
ncbi:MAG: hypothetical protein H6622_03585 [Halobacteriovoraceae bacterium]|nr:hypothetical protein [Halobacteriovoraceae bacterium]